MFCYHCGKKIKTGAHRCSCGEPVETAEYCGGFWGLVKEEEQGDELVQDRMISGDPGDPDRNQPAVLPESEDIAGKNPNAGEQGSKAGWQNPNAGEQGNKAGWQNPNAGGQGSKAGWQNPNAGGQGSKAGWQNRGAGRQDRKRLRPAVVPVLSAAVCLAVLLAVGLAVFRNSAGPDKAAGSSDLTDQQAAALTKEEDKEEIEDLIRDKLYYQRACVRGFLREIEEEYQGFLTGKDPEKAFSLAAMDSETGFRKKVQEARQEYEKYRSEEEAFYKDSASEEKTGDGLPEDSASEEKTGDGLPEDSISEKETIWLTLSEISLAALDFGQVKEAGGGTSGKEDPAKADTDKTGLTENSRRVLQAALDKLDSLSEEERGKVFFSERLENLRTMLKESEE